MRQWLQLTASLAGLFFASLAFFSSAPPLAFDSVARLPPGPPKSRFHRLAAGPEGDLLDLAVLSAYHSARSGLVTLIAASNAAKLHRKKRLSATLKCAFYDAATGALTRVSLAEIKTRYLVRCALKESNLPAEVFLFRNSSSFRPERDAAPWTVPVKAQGRGEGGVGLALCTKVLYASPDWSLLLQFFEHYLIQGASRFVMRARLGELASPARAVLRHYERLGVLALADWTHVSLPFCPPQDRWCQLTQINDCVQDAVGSFRYVAVVDFDELLRPAELEGTTLLDALRAMDTGDVGSFTFRARYQLSDEPAPQWPPSAAAVLSPWRLYRNTSTSLATKTYSPKSVVRPEAVAREWVHFPRHLRRGFTQHHVDPKKEGYFIHLKKSEEWRLANQTLKFTNYSVVALPSSERRYVERLEQRMRDALDLILQDDYRALRQELVSSAD